MSRRATVAKYVACGRIAVRDASRERGDLYGRMAFFVVILGVFSSLWRATREAGIGVGDPQRLIWYLAGTEWVLLSAPALHVNLQEAVRRGDVACQLGRPISYVGAVFAEGLGRLAASAPLLGVTAFVTAALLSGWIPPLEVLVAIGGLGLVASALLTALYVSIGLLAFWMEDVTPVFWVWQKLLFILGGLILPLHVYPDPLRQAALMTPFPAILSAPASQVLADGRIAPAWAACLLAIWCVATAMLVRWMYRRATASLMVNGG
ncbi:MAG: ABC-2 family transporter protein [Vicinamibacterales bacterium]